MGGAVYWRDANGNVYKASAAHPLPVSDGGAVQAADMSADAPLTWDAATTTLGITQDTAGGVPILDGSGKISASELPPLQHDVGEAATEAEMLALAVSAPAMCLRTDFSPAHVFMLSADPATDIGNWHDTGAFAAAAADPSADVGTTAVNGSAATYMRSDAAPAIDQGIAPTWTGTHIFSKTGGGNSSAVQVQGSYAWEHAAGAADEKWWDSQASTQALNFRTVTDANDAADVWMSVTRSGKTVTGIQWNVNGVPLLELKPDELRLSPSTIDNGKIRLWDTNDDENQFYGFGVNSGVLRYQVDTVNSDHVFYAATDATTSQELFRIKGDKSLEAQGSLHMSEQKIVNLGDGSAARDAVNKQQLDAAALMTVATHSDGATVTVAAGDPKLQLVDATAAAGSLTVQLPDGPPVGTQFIVKKVDSGANTVVVTSAAMAVIDGQGAVNLPNQWSLCDLVFDGTNWQILNISGV